jgi:hypothetical protein
MAIRFLDWTCQFLGSAEISFDDDCPLNIIDDINREAFDGFISAMKLQGAPTPHNACPRQSSPYNK